MTNLVIVESPTKAKTLTKILDNTKVLSTKGHFLELNDKWLTSEQREEGWPVQGVDHNFNPDWKYKSGTSSIIKVNQTIMQGESKISGWEHLTT